jgi:hypothetical protein
LIPKSNDYEELEMRATKFKMYERLLNFFGDFSSCFFFVILLPAITFIFFGWNPQNSLSGWAGIVIIMVIWFCVIYDLRKRKKKFKIENIEWATYYSYEILKNLEKGKRASTPELRKDYHKKAYKFSRDFLSCIKKRWTIGTFQLVKDQFEKPLSEFNMNFRTIIVPILEKGSQEKLDQVEQIITNLLAETSHLTVEGIVNINTQVSSRLKPKEVQILGKSSSNEKLVDFFHNHKMVANTFFIVSLIVGCALFYQGATIYMGIVKEYAFAGSVAIFVGLTGVYFTKRKS